MKWYLNRKINYYPFDLYLVNLGYIVNQKKNFGVNFQNTFYYYKDELTYSYRAQKDLDKLVQHLEKRFSQKFVNEFGEKIKSYSRELLKITEKTFVSRRNLRKYFKDFCKVHTDLLSLFQLPEYCQLFLEHLDEKLLIKFGMTRDYAIRRLIKVEKIYRSRLGQIFKLPKITALMLLPDEIEQILKDQKIPSNVRQRKTFSLYTKNGKISYYWNKKADQIHKKVIGIQKIEKVNQLKGQIAYKGHYRSKVYVALKQDDFKHIPKGRYPLFRSID